MDPFPLYPPLSWFTPPDDMPDGSDGTVISEGPEAGRTFGYVAPFNTCILTAATLGARTDECFTAPHSPTNYERAHQGHTVTLEGEKIRTANLGGGVNHYGAGSFREAVDHYANTASQLMRIRYGENHYGIWYAGALWPDVSERQVAEIRASATSGDWRWIPEFGAYDMAGSQLVNNPGFPMLLKVAALAVPGEPPPLIGGWGGVPEPRKASAMDGHKCTCGANEPDPVLASLSTTSREELVAEIVEAVTAGLEPFKAKIEEAVAQLLVNA